MCRWLFAAIVSLMIIPSVVMAQGMTSPVITAPTAGQILRGQVSITGTTDISNFASAELDFAYVSRLDRNMVHLRDFFPACREFSQLAIWDTTSISDGDYILRLRVTLQDGSAQDATVKVKVQNQVALPTVTAIITHSNYFHHQLHLVPQPATPVDDTASPTPHRCQYFPRRLRSSQSR